MTQQALFPTLQEREVMTHAPVSTEAAVATTGAATVSGAIAAPRYAVAPCDVSRATLRPYQREAVWGGRGFPGALDALQEQPGALLVAATGTGKTTIAATVVEDFVRRQGARVLFLAHRTELIEQAARRMVADTSLRHHEVTIEQGTRRARQGCSVVVASVQTMRGKRLARWHRDAFGLIITDEAHHSRAKTYEEIYGHFSAKRLGITATPDRGDEKGLGKWHPAVAYAYEIRDAIAEQYLVPVRAKMIFVEAIDLSRVRTTAGDLNEGDLEEVMMRAEALHGIAKPTVELAGERPTIVFANGVGHARALAQTLNGYEPGQARAIDGTASDELRRTTIRDFMDRRFRRLVNCQLYTEGVDLPLASCAVMARPTESRSLFCQMAGRVTRLLGATWAESVEAGKIDCLILDFVGNAGRHRLVTALDLLDGSVDEKTKRRASKRALEEEIDIEQALRQAESEEVLQQRLDLVAQVRYRVVDVADQFMLLGVRPRPGRWGGVAQTEKQLEVLTRAKIKGADKLDRGQASTVIDALIARQRAGLATLPMAQQLLRYGINPDLTFVRAHMVLDAIAKNGWRGVPAALIADNPDLILSPEAMAQKREKMGV